ncbi:MAG: hypothetical protein ACFFAQ_11170 [Promethearchaeota archaeon]
MFQTEINTFGSDATGYLLLETKLVSSVSQRDVKSFGSDAIDDKNSILVNVCFCP